MAERLKARPEILDRRREIVEHPFGTIKQWMNQGAFLMRGLEKVRAEFSLTALVYNLRRALNILGVEAMTAASRPEGGLFPTYAAEGPARTLRGPPSASVGSANFRRYGENPLTARRRTLGHAGGEVFSHGLHEFR